jgi:hypothetical protein
MNCHPLNFDLYIPKIRNTEQLFETRVTMMSYVGLVLYQLCSIISKYTFGLSQISFKETACAPHP